MIWPATPVQSVYSTLQRVMSNGDVLVDVPSSYPYFPNMRNAAASRPFRYSRSSILSSNLGMAGICILTLAFSAPSACVDCWALVSGMVAVIVSVAVGGAMMRALCCGCCVKTIKC